MAVESTISWDECLGALKSILPLAESFALNKISEAAEREGLKVDWRVVPNWENLNDIETLEVVLGKDVLEKTDSAILMPATCFYGDRLPFLVCQNAMKDFVRGFSVQYGECFFNGDTLILLPSNRIVYLFHHEGLRCKVAQAKEY